MSWWLYVIDGLSLQLPLCFVKDSLIFLHFSPMGLLLLQLVTNSNIGAGFLQGARTVKDETGRNNGEI